MLVLAWTLGSTLLFTIGAARQVGGRVAVSFLAVFVPMFGLGVVVALRDVRGAEGALYAVGCVTTAAVVVTRGRPLDAFNHRDRALHGWHGAEGLTSEASARRTQRWFVAVLVVLVLIGHALGVV